MIGRDVSASRAFKNVGDAADRAGRSGENFGDSISKGVKFAASALLGAGLIQGFAKLYDAAAESAKIGRLTEQVIKSTGGAAQISAQQVGALATAISKKTGVDDEAIQSGQNLLLTFMNVRNEVGKGNDIFNQASQTITDMSVALGEDTSSAAIQLGKALNDPIKGVTALQRVGVSFTESQKSQIATLVESGQTMEAQKIILAELSKEFGGAAEAASTPFDKLKVSLGNLAEQVGGFLTPAVDEFSGFLDDSLLPGLSSLATIAGDVLGPALHLAFGALAGAVHIFQDLPGPLQAAVVAFGAFLALRGPLGGFFENLGTQAWTLGIRMQTAVSEMGFLKAAGSGLLGVLGGPWGIAITAATLGIGLLSDSTDDNTTSTEAATQAQQSFADALRTSKGVITESVRQQAAYALAQDGILALADDVGISLETVTSGILGEGDAYNSTITQLKAYKQSLIDQAGVASSNDHAGRAVELLNEAHAVDQQITAYTNLAEAQPAAAATADQVARATGEAATAAGTATGAMGTFSEGLAGTADAAAIAQQALDDWINKLAGIDDAFVDPLGTYQEMLQAAAQATADSTASQEDSWSDFADSASVSLDEYAKKLEEQITNQQNWQTNLTTIAQRAGYDVAQQLANMGQDGVQLVAQMANGTDAEMQRMAGLMRQDANLAGTGASSALDTQMKVMAAIGAAGASATAQGIATQLGIGVGQVVAIARQYGTGLAGGINPILASLGKPQVMIGGGGGRAAGQVVISADGNLFENHQAEIAPGGAMRVWAEPETGGEAYIPLAPSKRPRSRSIASEAVQRLGGHVQWFANGGFTRPEDVPHPPSTAPYGKPISTAGDAAMDSIFTATAQFVRENGPAGAALAWAKSQVGKPYIWGGVGPAGYDCSGFMSAIANVIQGKSPYSRRGATANFPWKGFAPGDGFFTVGSTKDAGGGIGHMAGTIGLLSGVNVESRGGQGVVVGGSARGAHNSLFNTRAHLAMAGGGVIGEPVVGIGASGRSYSFGESGPETVTPGVPGGGAVFHLYDSDGVLMGTMRGHAESVVVGALSSATTRSRNNTR